MKYIIYVIIAVLVLVQVDVVAERDPVTDTSRFYTRHSYDVLKYDLQVDLYACFVSPFTKAFPAVVSITLRADSAIDKISLNAVRSSLIVDSVDHAGAGFSHLNDTLILTLNRPYQAGEILTVRVFYHHKNVNDNSFYASYGTVFTDSPPEGARKWMPCWDRPSDKAKWELKARVKAPAMLASNGLPASETITAGDTLIYHWKSDLQTSTYLLCFSSKINFERNQFIFHPSGTSGDSIPVMIYHKPGESTALIDSMIGPVTNFFSSLFGPYPFEKIGFATLNTQFSWGGMENQSMVHLRPNGYADLNLIVHEHSHQWFGDLVTCGTWADIWLNEGFGTFCQNLWVEYHEGAQAYKQSMKNVAAGYLSGNPGWPLYQPEWALQTPSSGNLYNVAITYNKGASVLYMLRYVLGDSLFFKSLRSYVADSNLRFGNAYTDQFIAKVNAASNQDMQWFFDQWVFGRNHPVYINTYQIDSLASMDWKVTTIIRQTQNNAGLFRMPVELRVKFANGTDTLITVMNDAPEQIFGFHFSKRPVEMVFDPDNQIILKQSLTIYHVDSRIAGPENLLEQNYPNPFDESTILRYHVTSESLVRIVVLDQLGRERDLVVSHHHSPGTYSLEYVNPSLGPGIYQVVLEAGTKRFTRKIVIQD